ncbi:MAG: RsmB/NOP family class I SAM-dependent RNA methyltransferase [Propioniciclava sp.]|nr:RsmB/NOP family class I SAM-dependent RNA methyltransferase [Propioniciclava sp.]
MAAGNRTLRRRRPDRPRLLAHRILGAVTQQDAYANLETARVLSDAGLDPRDAGFVTELVSGTCRLLGTYDRILAAASGRDSFDPALADALRLGTHQLLSMRVGHHAAISTTVDLAAATVGEKVAGLTNAVLRKVAARDLDGWVDHLARDEDALGRLALRTHHPRWIAQAYVDLLGDEADEALSANNVPPVPTLVVRPGLAEVSELDGEPTSRSPFGARRPGNPGDLPAVREGRAGVQDEGSQLVALALAESDAPEGPWLDLCAGPGGKAALLAGLAMQQGSTLLASELQPHRAELVAQALRAYDGPHRPQAIAADGTRPAWASGRFARVMADVPCTGLGALRRRPESRWRRTPEHLAELVPLQRRLLTSALDSAAPGGVVAYVTCSPHRDETEGVLAAVLADRDDVTRESTTQLWPHRDGTDAMFCALLRRRA